MVRLYSGKKIHWHSITFKCTWSLKFNFNTLFITEILILLDRDFYNNETTREMIHALTQAKIEVVHRISAVCDAGDLLPPGVVIEDYETHSLTTTEEPSAQKEEEEDKLKWNFYNSVFFAFTVITTIGKLFDDNDKDDW